MIKLHIVDDHIMVVESLSKLIHESGIAEVIGAFYDLKSYRKAVGKELPDILLLDIALSDGDGVEFCAELKEKYPTLKIIMLTTYKEFNIAKRALHNGALGYILKNAESDEMLLGIETVYKGKQFLCEEIDVLLVEKKDEEVVWLSNREKEVLKHVADGYTTKEIAALIYRDAETVKTYRRNLLVKLRAKNVAVLIKKAYEMKLIW